MQRAGRIAMARDAGVVLTRRFGAVSRLAKRVALPDWRILDGSIGATGGCTTTNIENYSDWFES